MAGFQILPPEEDPAGRRAAAIRPLPAAPPTAAPLPVDPRAAAIAEADAALNPAPPQAVRAMPAEPMPAPAMEGAAAAPGPSPLDQPLDMVALPGRRGTPGLTAGEKAKVKSVGSTGEAVATEAAINAGAQAQAADAMAMFEKKAAEEDARMAQEADERAARFEGQMKNLDDDIKTVREAKVDRSKVWTNKNGFQKAAIIISAMLHGSMTRGRGGVAPSLQLLNQEIESDVQDQMKFIDAQTKALTMKRQGISDRADMEAAREQAKLKAIAARRETMVMTLERIQAQAKSEAGKAKVQPLLDAMNAEQLQTQEKFAKLAQARAAASNKFVMIGPNGVPITLSREEAIKRASEIEKRDLEREKLGVDRESKLATKGDDVNKAVERLGAKEELWSQAQSALDEVKASLGPDGAMPGTGPVAGRLASLVPGTTPTELSEQKMDSLVMTMLRKESGAAISDEEKASFKKTYGLESTATPARQRQGLKLLEKRIRESKESVRSSFPKSVVRAYEEQLAGQDSKKYGDVGELAVPDSGLKYKAGR